jgi:hypothetical protein
VPSVGVEDRGHPAREAEHHLPTFHRRLADAGGQGAGRPTVAMSNLGDLVLRHVRLAAESLGFRYCAGAVLLDRIAGPFSRFEIFLLELVGRGSSFSGVGSLVDPESSPQPATASVAVAVRGRRLSVAG